MNVEPSSMVSSLGNGVSECGVVTAYFYPGFLMDLNTVVAGPAAEGRSQPLIVPKASQIASVLFCLYRL